MADEHNGNGHVENHGDNHGLRPQPHGGALRNGGTNKGGPGRPPSIIREKCRGAFAKRIKLLAQIAEGEAVEVMKDPQGNETEYRKSASVANRLQAMDLLAKYGLGTTVTETDTEGNDAPRPQVIAYIPENGRVSHR